MLSFVKIQYFKSFSDVFSNWDPVKFQQNDIKSTLFFFSYFLDLSGDYLISQNLNDYFDNVPNKLLLPNLTWSTLF